MAAIPASPWLGLLAVATVFALLLGTLTLIQRLGRLQAELVRKLFHLGSGALALTLPWLFRDLWPVLLLGAASLLALMMLRVVPVLRTGPGQVLLGVPRSSSGEFWFVVGVVLVFAIARDSVVIYSIGILILAVADTAAALVGVGYGQHPFAVPGGTKSTEGSIAFFLAAFLCVHVPVLLVTPVGRPESLLVALDVGLLVMMAEANATRGSDNVVLPVLVVVLLHMFLDMGVDELLVHTGVIVALGLFVRIYRRHTNLSGDALIGAALIGYLFWVFGDWRWLVAPVTLFSTYIWLLGRPRLRAAQLFHVNVIYAIAAPGVVLATAHAVFGGERLYPPFVAVWSANLAVIGVLHGQRQQPLRLSGRAAAVNCLKSLAVLLPGLLVANTLTLAGALAALLSVPSALLVFAGFGFIPGRRMTPPATWRGVPLAVGTGTLISFALVALVLSL